MKVCAKCKGPYVRGKGYCPPCKSRYNADRYRKNPDVYKVSSKISRKKTASIVAELKERPCADCGVQYPHWIMEFDHRPGVEKSGHVSAMRSKVSRAKLVAETKKCDVVCANCHRNRTYHRSMGT